MFINRLVALSLNDDDAINGVVGEICVSNLK